MTCHLLSIVAFLAFAADIGFASESDLLAGLDPYQPKQSVSGSIRSRGNNYTMALMKLWEEGFRRHQPGIRFETLLQGSETAIPALYSGEADLGFLGREIYQPEIVAFEEWFGYEPLGIEVTTGSYNNPHKTFALMIFVNKDNPLSQLTMTQVAGIIGCGCTLESKKSIRSWGQLGLTGEWVNRPIHVYGYGADSGFGRFFQTFVLKESYKWNPEMREFYNVKAADGSDMDPGQLILDALAKDSCGIAYSNVRFINADVKTLAVASDNSGAFIEPTRENVWKRVYPITRFTSVFINRAPGKPIDPKVKEFLRYILSRDGQEMVSREGSYLPLTPDLVRDQLRKLE
jgi:phosphate transport system substrate-binding protein